MPIDLVKERFPVSVIKDGAIVTQYLPIRSLWDGQERHVFTFNPQIKRVLFSCHGVGADAHRYADNGHDAADAAGVRSETLVIAPQFANRADLTVPEQLGVETNVLYWQGGRFWGGLSSDSAFDRPVRISSFEAMDQMMAHVASSGLFPNLETIVLAGQSGGGQFALRYAFASNFTPPDGIQVRYIPMNPGSVVYTSPKRVVPGETPHRFDLPSDSTLAGALSAANTTDVTVDEFKDTYDDYGYGFENLDGYAYLKDLDRDTLIARFRDRPVAYLIGENDNQPSAANLPSNPAAHLQGAHRLERSEIFEHHLRDEGVWNTFNHVRRVVPGVGHNGRATMMSDIGLWYLFGYEVPQSPSLSFEMAADFLEAVELINTALPGRGPLGSRTPDSVVARPINALSARRAAAAAKPPARTAFSRRDLGG
ncbi:MAG: hypothetical protein AAGA78_00370 [Pseudomonadota bacterium]